MYVTQSANKSAFLIEHSGQSRPPTPLFSQNSEFPPEALVCSWRQTRYTREDIRKHTRERGREIKLPVAEILSEATKVLRAEHTLGFVPTSSSGGSPAHTFAGDAVTFRRRESFIRGHVQHLSAMGAKAYRRGRTGRVLKIIGCKGVGWMPFGRCCSSAPHLRRR